MVIAVGAASACGWGAERTSVDAFDRNCRDNTLISRQDRQSAIFDPDMVSVAVAIRSA
jgi:hypothetical protein